MKRALIITHGNLGASFIGVLETIAGQLPPINFISNQNLSLQELIQKLEDYCKQYPQDDLFLFCEMKGGSPYLAARTVAARKANLFLITGLNLPMLISFVTKCDQYESGRLMEIIEQDAHRGISIFHGGAEQ